MVLEKKFIYKILFFWAFIIIKFCFGSCLRNLVEQSWNHFLANFGAHFLAFKEKVYPSFYLFLFSNLVLWEKTKKAEKISAEHLQPGLQSGVVKTQKMGPHFPLCNFFSTFSPMFRHHPQGVKNALGVGFLPNTQWSGGSRAGFSGQKWGGSTLAPRGVPELNPFGVLTPTPRVDERHKWSWNWKFSRW